MVTVATVLNKFWPARLQSRERSRSPIISAPTFRPLGINDFLALEIPPREMLLGPIMPEKSLAMLYAPRGLGKSWLALSMAVAVASGGRLTRWEAPNPRRVLFVDGEMPMADLQARLNAILLGAGSEVPNNNLQILAADNCEHGINLGAVEGQSALEKNLDGIDLLVIDNLSTLSSGSEGASDAWLPMQNWLLRLRRKGSAALLVHHAGVNGRQRGTSRREDALDTVIALRRPADYSPEQGARFEIHIEKARTLVGDGAIPFESKVEPFVNESGRSGIRWMGRDLRPPTLNRAAELFAQGQTVRQVATLLGLSRSEAGRLRRQAVAGGLVEGGGENQGEEGDEPARDEVYTLN